MEAVTVLVLARVVVGLLLLAHGLVHLLYLAPDVPEFSLDSTWLPGGARRTAAYVLMAATVVAFALVALAVWQVPGLNAAWPVLVVVAAALSLLLLVLYWSRQLVLGIVIDVLLIVAAVVRPGWVQRFVTGG
jgi:hypothetical protein